MAGSGQQLSVSGGSLYLEYSRNVYLEPTVIPSFGRENHGVFKGIDKEPIDILLSDEHLLLNNPRFLTVALTEPRKYFFLVFLECVGTGKIKGTTHDTGRTNRGHQTTGQKKFFKRVQLRGMRGGSCC
jgi:hypothetical protein